MTKKYPDVSGETLIGGIRLAASVKVQGVRPELLLGLLIITDLCNAWGVTALVTALLNGKHMLNSLHYTGAAVDFVSDLGVHRELFVEELRTRLGVTYDVIDEDTHIHVEYQPHTGAFT